MYNRYINRVMVRIKDPRREDIREFIHGFIQERVTKAYAKGKHLNDAYLFKVATNGLATYFQKHGNKYTLELDKVIIPTEKDMDQVEQYMFIKLFLDSLPELDSLVLNHICEGHTLKETVASINALKKTQIFKHETQLGNFMYTRRNHWTKLHRTLTRIPPSSFTDAIVENKT